MSSLVADCPPRQRANAGSEVGLQENGYSSPCSSPLLAQKPANSLPTSPEAAKHYQERKKKHRPQISIEQADGDELSPPSTTGSDSHNVLQDISPSDLIHRGSSPSFDQLTSPDRHNGKGVGSPVELVDGRLALQPRSKKSHTLPTEITCTDYLSSISHLQSGQSSLYNSSEGEYDSDDTSFQDPRHLLQDEKYWRKRAAGMLMHLQGGRSDGARKTSPLEKMMKRQARLINIEGGNEESYEEDYLSNSDNGSGEDEESMVSVAPSFVRDSSHRTEDDEVFQSDFCLDLCYEADTKLVDWSYNVFVPACRTLLFHCRDGDASELSSSQILADLRSLSNTISFFCSEQQQLSSHGTGATSPLSSSSAAVSLAGAASGGGSGYRRQGISTSISTDRISRIRDLAKSMSGYPKIDSGMTGDLAVSNKSSLDHTHPSTGGGGKGEFEGQDSMYDRNYSVKILRSVSQSLIAPLGKEAEEGFTPELYKSIVQAVQKIAWKVEACLAINDPSKETDVYLKIFDLEQQENLAEKMINALPPEEPKLGGGPGGGGRASRSGSISSTSRQGVSTPCRSGRTSIGRDLDLEQSNAGSKEAIDKSSDILALSPSKVKLRGAADLVGKRLSGVGSSRDSANSLDLAMSGSSDNTCVSSTFLDSISTTTSGGDTRHSVLSSVGADFMGDWSKCAMDMPAVRRDRIATFASPSRNSKAWRSFDQERGDNHQCQFPDPASSDLCSLEDCNEEPHYFRPKHVRRTTVSLSRREVSNLGWKKNRKVEKSASAISSKSGFVDRGGQDGSLKKSPDKASEISNGSRSPSATRAKRMLGSRITSLTKLGSELDPSSAETLRTKSASMSDLLDESPRNQSSKATGKEAAAVAAAISGSTAGHPKKRKSRNHSYDSCLEGDEREVEGGGRGGVASLKHQSSSDSTSVGEHLARSYLPVSKQSPTCECVNEEDWTLVCQDPDPAVSLDSSKRFRSSSRNSKIIISDAAKSLSRKARKAVVQKSLSASEKFTNKVIKTATALRRGSMSNFGKGRKDDSVVAVSASMSIEELQEEAVSVDRGERESSAVPRNLPPRPGSTSERGSPKVKKSGTLPGSKRTTLSRLSKKNKTHTLGTTNSLTRKSKKTPQHKGAGFVSNTQVAPAEQAALTESIYQFSKNAVQPSLEDSEFMYCTCMFVCGCHTYVCRCICVCWCQKIFAWE